MRISKIMWAQAATAVVVSCLATAAWAGVEFETVQTTAVELGEGVNPGARIMVSADGTVVLVSASADGSHLVPVTLGQGADRNIVYNLQDVPVSPDAYIFGPGGDVLLRGTVQNMPPLDPVGVTARISLDGEVVWEREDSAFSEDDSFIGAYVGAAGPVAWSPVAQRVLIFTEASFEVAPVSQGSMLFEFNGDVRVPSVLFGDEYIGATLNNALATPDGKFLVYYFSQNDRGTRFFLYDGAQTVSFFEPEGGDWRGRVVINVDYDPNQNLILLWVDLDEEGDATKAHLTKLDPEGKLLWEADLSGSVPIEIINQETEMIETVQADLLRPVFMVTAEDEVVLLRQVGQTFFFDVRSSQTGEPLGFFDFFALTENAVFDLTFLNGSDSEYLLSTVNTDEPTTNQLLQVKLKLNDQPVIIGDGSNNGAVDGNNGAGNNGGPLVDPDDEPERTPDIPDPGCVTAPGTPSPIWPAFVLGVFAWWWRRRSV